MSDEYIFGAHILEILTRGMYEDPRTIFREYVQNSCDAIDSAVKKGILQTGEGKINIWLDDDTRTITISDNGTGIKSSDFRRVMGSVADSDKRNNENRGFRGIGRLCGMAYCKTVIFTAKYRGENVISRLECNGGVLSQLLQERDSGIQRYTASEVLAEINEFSEERTNETDAHYFIVELENINSENTALIDDYSGVKDYLSYTAPLPYSITFDPFTAEIHSHAKELGLTIDEYNISLNDEQLFKPYTSTYHTSKGDDIISRLEFHDIRDKNGNLTAWMWFGVSCFIASIDRSYLMRGIRLRKGNIQIGDTLTMQRFFKEERGNNYFIGELFCVSDGLIPNSQRDYFNENPERAEFDSAMREYGTEFLHNVYYKGSKLNNLHRDMKQSERTITDIQYRINHGYYSDAESREKANAELQQAESERESSRKNFDKISASCDILHEVAENIQSEIRNLHSGEYESSQPKPKYSQNEQKLIRKIFSIIEAELGNFAPSVVKKIEEGLGLK